MVIQTKCSHPGGSLEAPKESHLQQFLFQIQAIILECSF